MGTPMPAPPPAPGGAAPSAVAVTFAPRMSASATLDRRYYVVWASPGRPDPRCVREGLQPAAWSALERRMPGGQYADSGVAPRRAAGSGEAVDWYHIEAARHGALLPMVWFFH